MKRTYLAGIVLLGLFAACSQPDPKLARIRDHSVEGGDLVVSRFYALPPFTNAPMAAYFLVWNRGGAADTLTGVSSDARYPMPMIHGPDMQSVGSIVIPPGDTLKFQPGGSHLMFEPPMPKTVIGDSVPIVLHFARAGEVSIWAPVIGYDQVDKVR